MNPPLAVALPDRPMRGTVTVLPRTAGFLALHTTLRDRRASRSAFVASCRRVMRIILEEALAQLSHHERCVTTPIGATFTGVARAQEGLFAVSVPRAGDAFEAELREVAPEARIGKILIQRDTVSKRPHRYYCKLPHAIAGHEVVLMDPMMATAGTAKLAIATLAEHGVEPDDVVFANFMTCPSALDALHSRYPGVRVVTGFVDEAITPEAFMTPGMGDFGDRFYGTSP